MKTNSKLYPWQLATIRKAWVAQVTLPWVISTALWCAAARIAGLASPQPD